MSRELPGAVKGLVVGFANTFVVAMCLALCVAPAGSALVAFVLIFTFGVLPGELTGALLGHVAATFSRVNRVLLLGIMIAVSSLAVAALGDTFDAGEYILVSCIPTAAACSVLERWTRKPPDDKLPLARVT